MRTPRALTVNVTQDCIDRGKRWRRDCCPIARALEDAGMCDPWVDEKDIRFKDRNGVKRIAPTPRSAFYFMDAFDNANEPVSPFTFTLEYL